MKTKLSFPEGFMWGAATSAYQVEGAAELYGKKLSQQDVLNLVDGVNKADVASDHYHHYKEDVALMKELGLTSYRFSLSWSRIFPDGVGEVNPEGLAFYDNLINELISNGIEPIPTLYHYDLPMALVEKYNGWIDRQSVDDFIYYAEFVIKHFADRVKYWLTINEQSIIVEYWTVKNFVPDEFKNDQQARYQINHHMNLAHAHACKLVHQYVEGGKIGAALGYSPIYPLTSSAADNMAAYNANVLRNLLFTDIYLKGEYNQSALLMLEKNNMAPVISPGDTEILKEGYSDFLAVNYYYSSTACYSPPDSERTDSGANLKGTKGHKVYENLPGFFKMCNNPLLDTTPWDWAIDPSGLEYSLRDLHDRYNKPLMITENGVGGYDNLDADGRIGDDYRIQYITEHLKAIQRSIDSGAEILSYNPWSFIDVLSTSNGYSKRYGFVYINRTDDDLLDLKRYRKDSFYWYQKVIESNGAYLGE